MRGVNNEQKCILISFNNRKSRPLSGLPLDQNLVVESTLKKRAMSAISFEKKNATHNRHQSQAGFASKRTLISNTDQQKKPVMIGSMRDRE